MPWFSGRIRRTLPTGTTPEQEESVYTFSYGGQPGAIKEAEFGEFKSRTIEQLRSREGFWVKDKYLILVDNWATMRRLNESHLVISWFCETLGGAGLDDPLLDTAQAQVEAAAAALDGDDLSAAVLQLGYAEAAAVAEEVPMVSSSNSSTARHARAA